LHALRQRHFKPAFAAILSAEHLAIARRDVDLLGVTVMPTDRHQRAVRRHLVEAHAARAPPAAPSPSTPRGCPRARNPWSVCPSAIPFGNRLLLRRWDLPPFQYRYGAWLPDA